MSFDLKLRLECDHRVYWEFAILAEDLQSLRLQRALGSTLRLQVRASGNLIPPSDYTVVAEPLTVPTNAYRMIYFNEKRRATDDYWEVSYQTIRENCPKCAALEVLDDIQYDTQGRLKRNRDENLLLQNLEKFTVTELGSNIFQTFVGTRLVTLLGEKYSDPNYVQSKIIQEINNSLRRFSDLQNQYESTGRTVTNGEILEVINNIEITQDENDPTIVRALVEATARSGQSIQFTQLMRKVA